MSPMTAQLIARELLDDILEMMEPTPSNWLSIIDELEHVERYGQTLLYLQTCYRQASGAIPRKFSEEQETELRDLFKRLDVMCTRSSELVEGLIGAEQPVLAVPKYYFSELRKQRSCALPQPPSGFEEQSMLSFLGSEAIASLRNAERCDLLAKERGVAVPSETWIEFAKASRKSAADIIGTMCVIYGEERVSMDLKQCTKAEQTIVAEMIDGASGRLRFNNSLSSGSVLEPTDDDDDDDDDTCSVDVKPIFIVSDCTGESAERTVRCSLGQFGHCFERSCPADIKTFRFCDAGSVEGIVRAAKERQAFVVFTLVDPVTNSTMRKQCQEAGIRCHDLWSPLLEQMEVFLDTRRIGVPGRRQVVDEKYLHMVECIEFNRSLDDGVNPKRWAEADILLVGPSRSGKTPLSFFMGQRGFKVANYPLVPDEAVPEQLYEFDQRRVFALTIDPVKLGSIRATRMKTLNMGPNTSYAQLASIQKELAWCRKLYQENPLWTVLDTTDAGVEESCTKILMAMDALENKSEFGPSRITDNPSAI